MDQLQNLNIDGNFYWDIIFAILVRFTTSLSSTWRSWVDDFVQQGSVAIKANDDVRSFFQTKKGLRMGYPISPVLFNIMADMLAILFNRAKEDGQITRLIPQLVDDGLS